MNTQRSTRRLPYVGGLVFACGPVPVQALTENFVPGMGDYIFFTFVISAVLFSSAILAAIGAYRWLVYAGFAALMVLNAAASGGVVSYIVGPTDFNLFVVPYLVFSGLTVYGFWMAGWLLEEQHAWARYRKWFYALGLAAAVGPLTSYFWLRRIPLNLMWIPEQILYIVMIVAQILPPLTWQALGPVQRRLVLAFPVVVGLFILGSAGVSQAFLELSQEELNTLARISIAVFVSFAMVLVLWQAFATTKAKQEMERQALETAKSEAELQLALVESEKQYERARSIAAQQRSQLAKVSHDLKQPISALRMAVGGMEVDGDKAGTLNRAIDYVDQLAQSFIAPNQPDGDDTAADAEALGSGAGNIESVSTRLFAQSLEQMFADEAQHAGVDFKVRCQEVTVSVVPLVTMRIFMNVVANALAHANASRILVTLRRRQETVEFTVYDDGVGMDAHAIRRAMEKGGKGPDSGGDGLGLSIVQDLCESQGYDFRLRSQSGQGTTVTVTLT